MSDSALVNGLGQLLENEGIGAYDPDGTVALPDDSTAITYGQLSQSHSTSIGMTPYGVDDDPSLSDSVRGVQFRFRATSDDQLADLADAVFDKLHGAHGYTLSTGVRIVESLRNSAAAMGYDGQGRTERADSYYFTIWRPSRHRT
jgi:hypothetical protein